MVLAPTTSVFRSRDCFHARMNSSRSSRDGSRTNIGLSRTAGIRDSRRCFSLVSRTLAPSPDVEHEEDALLDLECSYSFT